MKMYVEDLRPGDVFDLIELVERQRISRACVSDRMRRHRFVEVGEVYDIHENPEYVYVKFLVRKEGANEWTLWILKHDQVVEVKEW